MKANLSSFNNQWFDVEGEIGKLKYDFVDANNKDFTHWLDTIIMQRLKQSNLSLNMKKYLLLGLLQ